MKEPKLLKVIQGVSVYQDQDDAPKPWRIHYVADLSVDVDGAPHSYRLDNRKPPALDDIHASAGWPNSEWWNVLVRDPQNPNRPYVDAEGFCISMTSYQREQYGKTDRRRYVDPTVVEYMVLPGAIRKMCHGVVLGCAARMTRVTDHVVVDGVYADSSGNSIGEAGIKAAQRFGLQWNANNGDERKIYLYEFFPDQPAYVAGEVFKLKPMTI